MLEKLVVVRSIKLIARTIPKEPLQGAVWEDVDIEIVPSRVPRQLNGVHVRELSERRRQANRELVPQSIHGSVDSADLVQRAGTCRCSQTLVDETAPREV